MIKARLSVAEENQCSLVITVIAYATPNYWNIEKQRAFCQSSETHSRI